MTKEGNRELEGATSTYQTLANKLLVAMRSKEFKELARKTHKDIRYSELANKLEDCNKKLGTGEMNIVEWYLLCQHINANLVTYVLGSIASNLGEGATTIPVIKQISYLIDQLVICSLDLGNYIGEKCMNKAKEKGSAKVAKARSYLREDMPISKRHQLFEKYVGMLARKDQRDTVVAARPSNYLTDDSGRNDIMKKIRDQFDVPAHMRPGHIFQRKLA